MASSSDISKTDEVLILLNRLAAGPEEEKQRLLGGRPQESSSNSLPTRGSVGGPGGSFLQGVHASLHNKIASAVELGAALYRDPSYQQPPEASPLEIVLGEQRCQSERALRRSSNSFKRKLFGQPAGGEEEVLVEADYSKDKVRVHPSSSFRKYWEMATILLVIYTVLVLPFRAAFYLDYYRDLEHHHNLVQQLQVDWMLGTDIFVDVFLISDIVLNFNTGFIREQVLVMERRQVVCKYVRGWFLLDLVASFPIDLLFVGKRLDIWRLPRLLKIVRVLQYKTLTQVVHDMGRLPLLSKISRFHMRILRLLVIVLVWVHWDACLNYGACVYQHPPRQCWVDAHGVAEQPIREKYAWSVLKALSETITAGYGTQEPSSASDCWVTIVSLLAGTVIWTFVASIITTLLISMNAASSEYMVKIQEIDTYMQHRHLPQALRRRILDSYEARWKAEKHFNEEAILEELPKSLRIEVCMHMCADIVASVPFFEDAEEGFTTSVVTCLRPQVSLKGDILVREGEVSREMYFVKSGAAQVELSGIPVTVLKSGSYFGEIGLLRNMRRNATVRALSATLDLFVLTKEDFDEVMKTYPESFKAMDLVAEHRLRSLRRSAAWQLRQQLPDDSPHLGDKIEQVLQTAHQLVQQRPGSSLGRKLSEPAVLYQDEGMMAKRGEGQGRTPSNGTLNARGALMY